MGKILFIVGHGKSKTGGYDSGAVSGGYHEFKIAKEICKYAQEYYNKTFTEQCDIMNYEGNLYLQERINKLQDKTYDMIAEFHLNAGGGTGSEVFYYHGDTTGKKYAAAISAAIAKGFGLKDRGAKVKLNSAGQDYFGIIRATKPRALLIETVFIDNVVDRSCVKTEAGQKKCGEFIAEALGKARGVARKPVVVEKKTELYRVRKSWADAASQVGAYSDLANAKAACDKAGSAYYVFNESGKAVYPVKAATTTTTTTSTNSTGFNKGDEVKLLSTACYVGGGKIPSWVFSTKLYVRQINSNGTIVISTQKTGAVTGTVSAKYLQKYASAVPANALKVGGKCKLTSDAKYTNGKSVPLWVRWSTLYVREISGNNVVISTKATGDITGAVNKKYVKVV